MEQELVQAFVDFLSAIVPILATIVLAWITKQVSIIWANFKAQNPERAYQVEQAAKFGADFAEQLGVKGRVEDYAHSKKGAAMDAAKEWLRLNGYSKVDIDKLSSALDKAIEVVLFRDKEDYPSNEPVSK